VEEDGHVTRAREYAEGGDSFGVGGSVGLQRTAGTSGESKWESG